MFAITTSRPRIGDGCRVGGCVLLARHAAAPVWPGRNRVPGSDAQVLAELPAGARHQSAPAREMTRSRLDIALPLAQFYISRSRATGDLRFLGYAEACCTPWMTASLGAARCPGAARDHPAEPARIRRRAHQLDLALQLQPDNPQAWLTRATVLRVLGRYDEATASCQPPGAAADPAITRVVPQSLMG
jgi:hypothetical protein